MNRTFLKSVIISLTFILFKVAVFSQNITNEKMVEDLVLKQTQQVITWRRHLHQYPELSNREFGTMAYISKQLKEMGIPHETGMAYTGVVAVLDTGKPGPTIGLRADMDGLPVKERVDLPFASKVESEYQGEKVSVMHACGHDAHVAILLGVASILQKLRHQLTGKIIFVFQPAEEGAPMGEEGGAQLMIKEGLMEKYGIEVIFGLHVSSMLSTGKLSVRPRSLMASADMFDIKVKGKQTHGSRPWDGVDPITTSAQIILGLQTIVSRQLDLTESSAVISVGKISGGVRNNIIPEEVNMQGTIRTLDTAMQTEIHAKIKHTVRFIAESAGATAEVNIRRGYPVTYNNPLLFNQMLPSLETVVGEKNVHIINPITWAEDFSFYAQKVPGLFYFLGVKPPDWDINQTTLHHTPDFYVDETAFPIGIKSLLQLVFDYQIAYKP
ncbi:MAG: amidohydrolase [Saprospiraceae bacterium]